jgi:hypothetical protein
MGMVNWRACYQHGMITTQAGVINADLLAFINSQ